MRSWVLCRAKPKELPKAFFMACSFYSLYQEATLSSVCPFDVGWLNAQTVLRQGCVSFPTQKKSPGCSAAFSRLFTSLCPLLVPSFLPLKRTRASNSRLHARERGVLVVERGLKRRNTRTTRPWDTITGATPTCPGRPQHVFPFQRKDDPVRWKGLTGRSRSVGKDCGIPAHLHGTWKHRTVEPSDAGTAVPRAVHLLETLPRDRGMLCNTWEGVDPSLVDE